MAGSLLAIAGPALCDVRSTSGDVVLVPAPSDVRLDVEESDTDLLLFLERTNVVLSTDIEVDILAPGDYGPMSGSTPGPYVLPAGTRVTSYLMHIDPVTQATLDGGVVFDQPVLGIIISDDRLDATDSILGSSATTYPTGLALRGCNVAAANDEIRFTGGRRMATTLEVPDVIDQVRVLIGQGTVFSIDVGSDVELSDPTPDGNETLDPADMYFRGVSTGAAAFFDDAGFFSVTHPDPPSAAPAPYGGSCFPVGTSPSTMYHDNLDVDGFDEIGLDLVTYTTRPILFSDLTPNERASIHGWRKLIASFDDDGQVGWSSCTSADRMPTESTSPLGATYGTSTGEDELVRINITPAATLPFSTIRGTAADERGVHPDLAPNPDAGEERDDDVDALDVIGNGRVRYLSVDTEGSAGLSGGAIYLASPSGLQVAVPVLALGLQEEVDIDAFEFVWMNQDPTDPMTPLQLALLFSVDGDDVQTPADESGSTSTTTLLPSAIYYSFLDGTYDLFAIGQEDDIDALAALPRAELGELGVSYGFGIGCPCQNDVGPGVEQGCLNSTGQGATLLAMGSASVVDDDLVLEGGNLPPSQPAMLIAGTTQISAPLGDGLRLTGGQVRRLALRLADANGRANFGPSLGAAGAWQPGETRFLQLWYRDPVFSPCGTAYNLTHGLALAFTL